jgi:hypothetical protein
VFLPSYSPAAGSEYKASFSIHYKIFGCTTSCEKKEVVLSLSGKRREKDPAPESRFHADLRSSRSRSLFFGVDESSMDSWISGN